MKITVFGSGYVDLVTGDCLAEVGNDVDCIDMDQQKNDKLSTKVVIPRLSYRESMIRLHGFLFKFVPGLTGWHAGVTN